MVPVENVIVLSAALFVIGMIGAFVRRSLLAILLSVQLMLAAAGLAFVAFDRMWAGVVQAAGASPSPAGQVFVVMIWSVAAAQIALGLGIVVTLFRNRDSIDVEDASLLRW